MKSGTKPSAFQQKLYNRLLRRDAALCIVAPIGPILAALIVSLLLDADWFVFLLVFGSAALGSLSCAAFMFGLLRYLRRRYESEFLDEG